MILIVGVTGHVGREVCQLFQQCGVAVHGVVRPNSVNEPALCRAGVDVACGFESTVCLRAG
jgi:nucleoside-diphosphate-sugar epimerase